MVKGQKSFTISKSTRFERSFRWFRAKNEPDYLEWRRDDRDGAHRWTRFNSEIRKHELCPATFSRQPPTNTLLIIRRLWPICPLHDLYLPHAPPEQPPNGIGGGRMSLMVRKPPLRFPPLPDDDPPLDLKPLLPLDDEPVPGLTSWDSGLNKLMTLETENSFRNCLPIC